MAVHRMGTMYKGDARYAWVRGEHVGWVVRFGVNGR